MNGLDATRGSGSVMGRIAGQIIQVIYALLKQDAEAVSQAPAGQPLPPPRLYDPQVHHRHRHGDSAPVKPVSEPPAITLLPPYSS